MRTLLRAFTVTLLLVVGVITAARRDYSGEWIAFVAGAPEEERIYLMAGDGSSVQQLSPDDSCVSAPRWSPDGDWIAYFDLCSSPKNLLRMRPSGGTLNVVPSDVDTTYARWSPTSDWLLVARPGPSLYMVNVESGDERLLAEEYINAQVSPDGEWVYARPVGNGDRGLDRINVRSGEVEPLLDEKVFSDLSWSPDGKQIALVTDSAFGSVLNCMAADGSEFQTILNHPSMLVLAQPTWSPDGEWIAFWGQELSHWRIFRIRPDGSDMQRLTEHGTSVGRLQWSPDGQWLTYAANSQGKANIFRLRGDGSQLENLRAGAWPEVAPVSGSAWRPLWLIFAAVGMFVASMVLRFRP